MLIGSVVSLILLAGILNSAVLLIDQERTEGIKNQTQQDLERALKYMANDLRESVYVYDFSQKGPSGTSNPQCLQNAAYQVYGLCGLPNFSNFTMTMNGNTSTISATPILAFWKLVTLGSPGLTNTNLCNGLSTTSFLAENSTVTYQSECQLLQVKRRMYSLVVYLQTTSLDPNWPGQSRILRYELPKYDPLQFSQSTATNPARKYPGIFIDPVYTGNFTTWPNSTNGINLQSSNVVTPTINSTWSTNYLGASVNPNISVLTDFVDSPTSTADPNVLTNTCDNTAIRMPINQAASSYTSFFACVTSIGNSVGTNQVVTLYLRGNIASNTYNTYAINNPISISSSNNSVLPPMQIKVTLRGVIDKTNF